MAPSRIHVLAAELADQIAAGEVVERPASAVKELVENALDAGARRVEVEIEGGGLERLLVRDDGCGMTPEEAHLALRRHATSKLVRVEDLFALSTMGFRGEALPSIAAVSRLRLTTRTAEDEAAYCIEVAGGVAGEARAAGAPVGTEVEVRSLFANVPARLKFAKSAATETAHVSDVLTRLALAFPAVHLRLRVAGRPALELPPHADPLERARAALGRPRQPALLHPVEHQEHGIGVQAFLGSPAASATTSRGTFALVNRRFVRDRGLLHAISMGYGELVERGRYPLVVVQLTIPGDAVDVNVHPQKLEVRFARPQEVYAAVRHAVAGGVARAPWLGEPAGAALKVYSLPRQPLPSAASPPSQAMAREPAARQGGYEEHRRRAFEAMRLFAPAARLPGLPFEAPGERAAVAERAPEPSATVADRFFSSLVYLGQLHRTYLVCQAPGELVLVDQHAAHERVAFERLRSAHRDRKVESQRLLLPVRIELAPALAEAAREHAALVAELGFEIALTEEGVEVRALPALVGEAAPEGLLPEVLGELAESAATSAVQERFDRLYATLACHSVVRAGDPLNEGAVRALFQSMDGVDYRAHCPHGRPVLLRMGLSELERRFGRS